MARISKKYLCRVALLGLLLAVFAVPAAAAEVVESQSGPGTTELKRLRDTLTDEQRRQVFVQDLSALIAAREAAGEETGKSIGTHFLELLSYRMEAVGIQIAAVASSIGEIPRNVSALADHLASSENRTNWFLFAAKLVAILAAGVVAGRVVAWALGRTQATVEAHEAGNLWLRALLSAIRALLDLIAVVAFMAAAYGTMSVLAPVHSGKVLALALINATVAARVVLVFAIMVFAPRLSMLRVLPLSDETANYCLIWVRRLIYVLAFGYFFVEALPVLGVAPASYVLLQKLLGLVLSLMLVVLILQNRTDVAAFIRGRSTALMGQLRRRVADIWHLVAIVYVSAIYAVWALEVPGGFDYVVRSTVFSILILLAVHAAAVAARNLLGRAFSLSQEQKERFPGLEARASRYLPIVIVGIQVFLYSVALIAALHTWGVDVLDWILTPVGGAIVRAVVNIVLILVLSMVAWEFVSAAIERYLAARDEEGNIIQRGHRAQTLLPLVRNVVMIVLYVFVILTVLSEFGLNIGPLIAGAGIIGLAIGFGAQTFVKDVITGFFILIEDTVAVGDIVVVGGYTGKVEAMSIRSIQLRDLKGSVHRIPFSEVASTTNHSKIYSFAFFDIGVAYRESVDRCMDVIRQVGAEIREDPEFGPLILEDIDIMGVQSFDDSAVVIRSRLKVLPGKQLGVQRAFNRLIKNRFDAEGIEIPFPHRTIYFGVDGQGKAPAAHVLVDGPPRAAENRDEATPRRSGEDEKPAT